MMNWAAYFLPHAMQHKQSRKRKVTRYNLWCGFEDGQTGPAANPVLIVFFQ
jgi:hypothetical protein